MTTSSSMRTPAPAPTWQERLDGTNINSRTLLASDYLNHFNEVVMLLDLVETMPDCVSELTNWRPRTYCEHFAQSSFPDRQLAIDAYAHTPPDARRMLEQTTARMDRLIIGLIERIASPDSAAAEAALQLRDISRELHILIDRAGSIINGTLDDGARPVPDNRPHNRDGPRDAIRDPNDSRTQAVIDSLFD